MATAAIRAQLAARGIAHEPPYGCSWCGDEQHHHGSQWAPIIGMHQWVKPSQAKILERMRRRRANRLSAEPAQYHATTGWAPGQTGESGEPYCADCQTDGCRQWIRIESRLDRRRMELAGVNPKAHRRGGGSWGGEAVWPF